MTLSSCVTEASKNDLRFSLACSQSAGLSCSSVVIKQCDQLHRQNATSSLESNDEILTYWWRPLDYNEQVNQVSAREHSNSDQCFMDLDVAQSSGAAYDLTVDSVSDSCSMLSTETLSTKALTIEPGENVEDSDIYEKLEMSTCSESLYEQLNPCIGRSVMEECQPRKLQFPDKKLRLLDKLLLSSCLEFRAEVHVKLDKHVVKISGTADDIEDTDAKLHELVVSFVTAGVDVSATSAKLLSTNVGEDWLDARLTKEQLVAIFYIEDTMPVIMTDCPDRLTRVKHLIESSLVIRHIPLERHQFKLLQSAVWKECIDDLQSTHLLQIFEADMMLVVEGCSDSAEDAVDKLSMMLAENSRISHTVKPGRGVYQVLCSQSRDILQDAKYVACF